jgi:SAM-dependent methyltransferase
VNYLLLASPYPVIRTLLQSEVGPVTVKTAARKKQDNAQFSCPQCGRDLSRAKAGSGSEELTCSKGHRFPVIGGVPRFVDSEAYAESFGIEWKRFPRTQLDSYNGTKVSYTRFKQLTGIDPADLRGKRVLDVGCGSGRFLELVARSGAEAYGADLSAAVDVSSENLRQYANCSIVQADLFKLPFAKDHFDFIYSIGVLHHTPDPEAAFRGLVKHLKPGGRISIWVYGLGVSSGIRARWIPRPSHVFGPMFRLLPLPARIKALEGFARFALVAGSIPVAGRFLKHIFWIDDLRRTASQNGGWDEADPGLREKVRLEWARLSAFDAYNTTHVAQTPHDEVVGWARRAGLVDIVKSQIPSAITATKPA